MCMAGGWVQIFYMCRGLPQNLDGGGRTQAKPAVILRVIDVGWWVTNHLNMGCLRF